MEAGAALKRLFMGPQNGKVVGHLCVTKSRVRASLNSATCHAGVLASRGGDREGGSGDAEAVVQAAHNAGLEGVARVCGSGEEGAWPAGTVPCFSLACSLCRGRG